MAQILDQLSLGGRLGQSLGTGLGSGLQSLAQLKLQDLMSRQQFGEQQRRAGALAPQLEQAGLPGVLAQLDPQVQAAFLRNFGAAQQQAAQQEQAQQLAKLMEQVEGGAGVPSMGEISPQQRLLEQLSSRISGGDAVEAPQQTNGQMEASLSAPQTPNIAISAPAGRNVLENQRLRQILQREDLSPLQKQRLRDQISKRQEVAEKRQDAVDKKTEPYFSKTFEEAQAARAGNNRLAEMKKLVDKGELDFGALASVYETLENVIPSFGIGINMDWALRPDSQKFKKLTAEFLRDMKKIFGGRVTNLDVREFLKSVPRVSQTDEGKLQVIQRLASLNGPLIARGRIMQEIIDENQGFRPPNLQAETERRLAKFLDGAAEEFKKPL